MTRRRRGVLTVVLAAAAGLTGMALARNYSEDVSRQFGPLRPVVVSRTELREGIVIDPTRAGRLLERRRIPIRFAPAGSFRNSADVVGLRPKVDLPAGSYVTSGVVGPPGGGPGLGAPVDRRLVPVEVSVHGAGALPGRGQKVDVLVSRSNLAGQGADTSVVARSAVLLDFASEASVGTEPGTGRVTLGLGRSAAIRVVGAEAAGSRITLIPIGVG